MPDYRNFQANPDNPVETNELVRAMFTGYATQEKVLADGKVDFQDIPTVVAAAPTLYKGFVGIKYIDDELAVMSEDGREELKAVIEEFAHENQDVEKLVEETLLTIAHMVRLGKLYYNALS